MKSFLSQNPNESFCFSPLSPFVTSSTDRKNGAGAAQALRMRCRARAVIRGTWPPRSANGKIGFPAADSPACVSPERNAIFPTEKNRDRLTRSRMLVKDGAVSAFVQEVTSLNVAGGESTVTVFV